MNRDLTQGRPAAVLFRFCIPLIGSILFQQMYNIADSLIAGRFIGEDALAAVGNGYQITLIFIAFAFGCNIGCSVVVSQLFGAKKIGDMKTAVYTTWVAAAAICVILVGAGLIACKPVLELIRTPENIINDSDLYLRIYICGFPLLLFYNVATGIFTALGDSKTPFIFLAASSTANVAADILFVKVFNMAVAGLAWATFICQGISCALAVVAVVMRLSKMKTNERSSIFSWDIFKKLAKIAVPSILQQSFISVGNIIIQGTINDFGSGVIAGYATSVKLNNLVITSFTTLGSGMSNYTAQNMGAGKTSRIPQGFKAGVMLDWIICAPVLLAYMLASAPLVRFFMDKPSADAMKTGVEFLRILTPFYCIISVKILADGVLRGLGKMNQFLIATFTDLILRVVLAIIFSRIWGEIGIWCAWPVGWIVATVISLLFYRKTISELGKNTK